MALLQNPDVVMRLIVCAVAVVTLAVIFLFGYSPAGRKLALRRMRQTFLGRVPDPWPREGEVMREWDESRAMRSRAHWRSLPFTLAAAVLVLLVGRGGLDPVLVLPLLAIAFLFLVAGFAASLGSHIAAARADYRAERISVDALTHGSSLSAPLTVVAWAGPAIGVALIYLHSAALGVGVIVVSVVLGFAAARAATLSGKVIRRDDSSS